MTNGEKLLADMKATAGTRFIAAERMRSKDRLENSSVAFLSAAVVTASLVPLLFELDGFLKTSLSLGVLASSILILVLSMRIYAEKSAVVAEELSRSALEISAIRRLAVSANLDQTRTYRDYAQKYSDVLDKFSVNHSERDFQAYKKKHPWEFEDSDAAGDTGRPYVENFTSKVEVAIGILAAGLSAAAALVAGIGP